MGGFLKRCSLLGIALVLGAGVAACGSDSSDSSSSSGSSGSTSASSDSGGGRSLACRDGSITVGMDMADSGSGSFFDLAGRRGLLVAIDQINASGGIKGCRLKVISADMKSDPAVGATVAKSLLDQGAQILFVPDDFDLGIAAARAGQEAGALTLSSAASSTQFGRAVGDLFFNAGITTIELGLAQGRYALDQGYRTAFQVIDAGGAYFTEQDPTFRKVFEAGGGRVVGSDKVDSIGGQSDYASTISKIKSTRPDVIQALAAFPGVGTFVKQLRAAGITTPVLGNVTLDTQELPKLVGRAQSNDLAFAVQVYFSGAGTDPRTDPEILRFTQAYQRKFGHFPEQANAPESYQMMLAIAEALKQRDVTDAKTAADAIRAQRNVRVPGGTLLRWQDGYAVWNPVIVGIDGGEFRQLDTYDAGELRSANGY
ncbi:ABC transporter substrate-binding protein [Conexibacter sp. CPCC 206217]|uniref:ABC transporter substrate-binding protein n=1 Tax=Conexibacter sp. CPCC 206217 TaxID=3064574 RepID=UPI0027181BD4|nr:ABC transporter substrate-binding protein [Conexibacter sp. CPCC 206217]MDO8209571.1 ABC transporter substrate-binding protein [Conexibacter sp. CPCC 206217]